MGTVASERRDASWERSSHGTAPAVGGEREAKHPLARAHESRTEAMNHHTVDPKLLEILVCPLTKGPLEYAAEAQELISRQARLAYPIRDGIPIMLVDEARQLDD